MRKKLFRVAAGFLGLLLLLSGCHRMVDQPEDRLIYASFYPVYALALPLFEGVEGMDLKCLVQPQDSCLRDYQLSEWDAALLGSADAVILGGRGLESFESMVSGGGLAVVTAMDNLTLLGEGATSQDGEEDNHYVGENPWLFLSVDGAKQISESIAAGMAGLDPGYEGRYAENLATFGGRLDALKALMQSSVGDPGRKRAAILQEGLAYMTGELGLNVVETIGRETGANVYGVELESVLERLKAANAQIVLIEAQAPQNLCRALEAAGYEVVKIDVLSTGFAKDPEAYEKAMLKNAQAVGAALSR